MKIIPAHLAACLPQLEEFSGLLARERSAILDDDLSALGTLSSAKSAALKSLAAKLMTLAQTPAADVDVALADRAVSLLKDNMAGNKANGLMLNLRSARKQARLTALTDSTPLGYGRQGLSTPGFRPQSWARA